MSARKWLLGGSIASAAAFCTVSWLAGGALAHRHSSTVGQPPEDLAYEAITLRSESGSQLSGWYGGGKGAGSVLLLHGVGADRRQMLGRARFLSAAGYSVLLIDLQAHGESGGRQVTFGYLESRDARAAVDMLRSTRPSGGVAVIGSSLGGAAAVLATPPLGVDALVLEAVYPTIEEATDNRIRMRLGPLSRVLTPVLLVQLGPRLGVAASELRPIDRIGAVGAPVLLIAGSEDEHTTAAQSRALFAAANEPKELWMVEGAAHVDFHWFVPEEYQKRVLRFLASYLGSAPPPA